MEENCRVECNMDLHLKMCDCLPYFFYNTENVETCSFKSIECMVKNRGEVALNQVSEINKTNFFQIFCATPKMMWTAHAFARPSAMARLMSYESVRLTLNSIRQQSSILSSKFAKLHQNIFTNYLPQNFSYNLTGDHMIGNLFIYKRRIFIFYSENIMFLYI